MHLFSAIPDIECDRAAGITTTAVFLGRKRSLLLCLAFWTGLAVITIGASGFHPLSLLVLAYPAVPALLLASGTIPIERILTGGFRPSTRLSAALSSSR